MQGVDVLREQTRRYIEDLPSDVAFTRSTLVNDGAGGTVATNPTPIPPQRVKVTQQGETSAVERRNASGEVVKPALRVLAEWDADIKIGDTFTWGESAVEVVWITELPYEKVAEVAVR